MGFPTNDGQGWEEHAWGSGIRVDFNGGSFNDGAILHKSGLATTSVHGNISAKYSSIGGTGSFLGYPISDEHRHNGNAYSAFEGGCITGPPGSYAAYGWGTSQCGSKHAHVEGPNA